MLSLQKCGVATECPEITHPRGGFTQHFCDPREALWRESTTPGSTARGVKQPGPRLYSERHGATGGRFLSGFALRAMWPGRGVYAVCQLHVIVGLKTHCLLPVMLSSRAAKARKTGGIGLNSTFLKTQHNAATDGDWGKCVELIVSAEAGKNSCK